MVDSCRIRIGRRENFEEHSQYVPYQRANSVIEKGQHLVRERINIHAKHTNTSQKRIQPFAH